MKLEILLIATVATVFAAKSKLPSFITPCNVDDPALHDCLLKATEFMRPYLIKGVPELNVPSIDPFTIPEVNLQQNTNALNIKAKLTQVVLKGLSNYKFSRFDFNVPTLEWNIQGTVQPITVEGKYEVTGRILGAPIEGNGNFIASIETSNVTSYHKVEKYTKKNDIYVRPVTTQTTIRVGGPKVKLDGLFGNDSNLNSQTNKIINDNADILFEELRPVVQTVINQIMEKIILESIENKIPYKDAFPPKS